MCKQCNSLNKANNNPLTTDHEPPRWEAVGKCDYCGKIITAEMLESGEAIESVEGVYFCSAEHANNMNFWPCECCGEYFDNDTAEVVASNYGSYREYYAYCSEECAEADGCFKCDRRGEWYRDPDESRRFKINGVNKVYQYYSEGLATLDGWGLCKACGGYYNDKFGEPCQCVGVLSFELEEYHARPHRIEPRYINRKEKDKAKNKPKSTPIFGIELELEPEEGEGNPARLISEINTAINKAVYSNDGIKWANPYLSGYNTPFCWYEKDGSLKNGGVEIITQPCSFEWWGQWGCYVQSLITEAAKVAGYAVNGSDNGGLHIHVNKEYTKDTEIRRIAAILEISNQTKFTNMTGRKYKNGGYYDPNNTDALIDIIRGKRCKSIDENHCHALSGRVGTYELRIFDNDISKIQPRIFEFYDLLQVAKHLTDESIRVMFRWITPSYIQTGRL